MITHQLTIHEAHHLLKSKQLSSVELTESCLERISQIEPKVRAFVTITEELALEQACRADKLIAAGDTNPLCGIPALIKDVICTEGVRTTCSSKMLENFVPPYNATVVEKLTERGAVILGKSKSGLRKPRLFPCRPHLPLVRRPICGVNADTRQRKHKSNCGCGAHPEFA